MLLLPSPLKAQEPPEVEKPPRTVELPPEASPEFRPSQRPCRCGPGCSGPGCPGLPGSQLLLPGLFFPGRYLCRWYPCRPRRHRRCWCYGPFLQRAFGVKEPLGGPRDILTPQPTAPEPPASALHSCPVRPTWTMQRVKMAGLKTSGREVPESLDYPANSSFQPVDRVISRQLWPAFLETLFKDAQSIPKEGTWDSPMLTELWHSPDIPAEKQTSVLVICPRSSLP